MTELIREAHAGATNETTLRRLTEAFARVCDAVGYAHTRDVVHRDLKPDNVMVGAHGEVFVLDWGIARIIGRPESPVLAVEAAELPESASVVTARSSHGASRTRVGGVLGTAAYMPPEQARGEVDRLDARADVYALGAMLYELLSGRPPYQDAGGATVLDQVLAGPPPPPGRGPDAPLPPDLAVLCARCMAREPAERLADGAAVALHVRAWLEGALERERALEVIAEADSVVAEAAALRARATTLRAEGEALLAGVQPWAPEEEKVAAWTRLDDAAEAEREAALLVLKREALLRGALTHAPDLVEAHAGLAALQLVRHREAEALRDIPAAERAAARLREHAGALPSGHPVGVHAIAYLRGDGALTLHTDPPGAEVELYRYELHHRRRVAVPAGHLGTTPLVAVSLPMGSYLLVIRHPERAELRYPVDIGRGEHWAGVPPGASGSLPVRLPRVGELGADDRLVPAGWFLCGGDPEAVDGLPRRWLWCDALVFKRFPVTNREYLVFLDDLVQTGREEDALRWMPRERGTAGEGAPVYGRDGDRFVLRPDSDGDVWQESWPVSLIDWFAASAYARWYAARTRQPWRLPGEIEWEKAARGVDGRYFPWGDTLDPSWCCMRASHPGRSQVHVVDTFPTDESVYGVRGLAGGVSDWCADRFSNRGPPLDGDCVPPPPEDLDAVGTTVRAFRGGHWAGAYWNARVAGRAQVSSGSRYLAIGFRLACRPGG